MNQIVSEHESIAKAIGRIASGVYIVTLNSNNERQGLLATWINQVSFKPAMLMLAVNKERPLLSLLKPGQGFTVNVLSKKNMDIFKAFAKPAQTTEERFTDLKILDNPSYGPIFAEAVAHIDCKTHSQIDAGDHVVFLAEILAGTLLNADEEPMTHLRKNGFQY